MPLDILWSMGKCSKKLRYGSENYAADINLMPIMWKMPFYLIL